MRTCACIVVVALVLTGCATNLSQLGATVRQIQPDWATRCRFLGVVEASEGRGWDVQDDQRGALNQIRNKVATLGGNAYALSERSSSGIRTFVQVDAYSCPQS